MILTNLTKTICSLLSKTQRLIYDINNNMKGQQKSYRKSDAAMIVWLISFVIKAAMNENCSCAKRAKLVRYQNKIVDIT